MKKILWVWDILETFSNKNHDYYYSRGYIYIYAYGQRTPLTPKHRKEREENYELIATLLCEWGIIKQL